MADDAPRISAAICHRPIPEFVRLATYTRYEELLVGSRAVFSRFNGTFGRLISYSDKRAPWVKKEPIFYAELSTCWY
jgi:hypothetical protein